MSKAMGTHARRGERGAVSIKAVLLLFMAGAAIFVVAKIAPVYIEQREILYKVDELANKAALRGLKEDKINQEIKRINLEYNLPDSGINASRNEKGVHIAVSYQRNIDLLVTTYAWKVDHIVDGKEL